MHDAKQTENDLEASVTVGVILENSIIALDNRRVFLQRGESMQMIFSSFLFFPTLAITLTVVQKNGKEELIYRGEAINERTFIYHDIMMHLHMEVI